MTVKNYKNHVGPKDRYDVMGGDQFVLMTILGLRSTHTLLDIGCGSLRAGKLFLPYLEPGKYFGLEPEQKILMEGLEKELGQDIINAKQPTFDHNDKFEFNQFETSFDFILAQSIFTHASQNQIQACLNNLQAHMHNETIMACNFKLGADYKGTEWLYPKCARYEPTTIENFFNNANLSCKRINWYHPTLTWWLAGPATAQTRIVETANLVNLAADTYPSPLKQYARKQENKNK